MAAVERDLKRRGVSLETTSRAAADRVRWRSLLLASRARRCREKSMNEMYHKS